MPSQFRNLVFEGGGVKGIAYAGALEVLQERGAMADVVRTGGTSAGAITACLVAVGATAKDVGEIVGSTHFRSFMDDSFGVIRDAKRFLNDFGWYKGEAFARWIQKQIYALTERSDLTFRQLKEDFAAKQPGRFRELYVVGTDLSMQLPGVYSAEHTPDFPIWLAVRISMSIPLFFAAVRDHGRVHVDGGVTWNYPLDLFDDRRYLSDEANPALYVDVTAGADAYPTSYGPAHVYNKETLGLRVDSKDEIKVERDRWRRPPLQIDDFLDYVKALVGFMLDTANDSHLHNNDWHRTVFLDSGTVKATDFDLSDETVAELVKNGRKGAKDYFDWFDKPAKGQPDPINKV